MARYIPSLLCITILFCLFLNSLIVKAESGDLGADSVKIGQGVGNVLDIYYCYSCGYKKVFDDYSVIISQKYPSMIVRGANYDPPGMNMYLSRILSLGKMLIIMCIISGVNIFGWINKPVPSWWNWCLENKMYACMMVFFLSNMVEGQLVSSGAFEISLNNIPLWSKLDTGRIPQPPELFQIIDNSLEFPLSGVNKQ